MFNFQYVYIYSFISPYFLYIVGSTVALRFRHVVPFRQAVFKPLRPKTLCVTAFTDYILHMYVYRIVCLFPKQGLLYGVLAYLKVGERIVRIRLLRSGGSNDSRRRFIDIDAFYLPYYCSGKFPRPLALQPQHFDRARYLSNVCQNIFQKP